MSKILNYFKKYWGQIILIIGIIILLYLSFYPLFMMIIKSFKTISDDQSNPFGFPTKLTLENYQYAWVVISPHMINSIVISVIQTLGVIIVSTLGAFAFVKFKFPFKNVIFIAIISIMMIPGIVTLTSQYKLINILGLIDNRLGVILPGIAGTLPFAIFLLRSSFSGVPQEIMDAAEIDGASDIQIYKNIMIPIAQPIIWTVIITTFIGSWNDYLWSSLVLLSDEKKTIPLALVGFTESYYQMTGGYGAPFAAYVISSLPLLLIFVLASKKFITGLTSGAIKM